MIGTRVADNLSEQERAGPPGSIRRRSREVNVAPISETGATPSQGPNHRPGIDPVSAPTLTIPPGAEAHS